MVTHDSLEAFDRELIFERDREAMEGTDGLSCALKILIDLFGSGQSTIDEYFREAVGLVMQQMVSYCTHSECHRMTRTVRKTRTS